MMFNAKFPQETLPLVRSIHLLSNAKPQAMDLQRATSLLPYLRQASTVSLREIASWTAEYS